MKKYFLTLIACAILLLAGCKATNGMPNVPDATVESGHSIEAEKPTYDESEFFVKTIEYQECNEYVLCYRHEDGTIDELVNMGTQESPFYIIGERIYYTQGDTLISISFTGEDKKTLYDDSEANISFNEILHVENDWLYCSGTKWEEIYDDPAALDGPHRVPIVTKVKTDFSEFHEIGKRFSKEGFVIKAQDNAIWLQGRNDKEAILMLMATDEIYDQKGNKLSFASIEEGMIAHVSYAEIETENSKSDLYAFRMVVLPATFLN